MPDVHPVQCIRQRCRQPVKPSRCLPTSSHHGAQASRCSQLGRPEALAHSLRCIARLGGSTRLAQRCGSAASAMPCGSRQTLQPAAHSACASCCRAQTHLQALSWRWLPNWGPTAVRTPVPVPLPMSRMPSRRRAAEAPLCLSAATGGRPRCALLRPRPAPGG